VTTTIAKRGISLETSQAPFQTVAQQGRELDVRPRPVELDRVVDAALVGAHPQHQFVRHLVVHDGHALPGAIYCTTPRATLSESTNWFVLLSSVTH